MSNNFEATRIQNITRAKAALGRVRSLRRTRRSLGVDGICQHIKDVDGNWLENWMDEKSASDASIHVKNLATT